MREMQNSGLGAHSSPGQDVVGVFEGFTQVFRDARPMTASVKQESKLMEHPTESGNKVTDHAVDQPVEIELSLTLTPETCRDTYKEIRELYREKKLLTVQTKADSFENHVIQAMPHDELPDFFDTLPLTLKLKEIRMVEAEFKEYSPSRTSQSSTKNNGEVPSQQEKRKGSWIAKKFPGLGND